MIHFVLRFALGLMCLFVAVIGILRTQPYDDSAARSFFQRPRGCALPCWEGIQPGMTTEEQAWRILDSHPWVANLRGFETSWGLVEFSWQWSGRQPRLINGRAEGSVWIADGVVQEIRLNTTLAFGDVWLLFDQPERGGFAYGDGPGLLEPTAQLADYGREGVQFVSALDCQDFWRQKTDLVISSTPTEFLEAYNLPGFRQASCGD